MFVYTYSIPQYKLGILWGVNILVTVKRQFVDGEYGQVHFRIAHPENVTKRPLVCLHMFPQSSRNFEHFLPAISHDRIVIAPDLPGYGESDGPSKVIGASEYAASVWKTIDALSLTQTWGAIDIFGIHAGSKLAVEVCYQRPGSIHKIFLSSAAVLNDKEVASLKAAFKSIPLDDEGTRFKHLWDLQIRNRGTNMTYEMMATGLAEMLRGGEKMEWGHYAVFDYNRIFPDRISTLPHPIALLNPKDDLYEMTPRTLPYLQNGLLIDKPEWSHGFLEKNAEELAKLMDEFLSTETILPEKNPHEQSQSSPF